MIPDRAPAEDVFHGSEQLKKGAHVPSFDKYRELYRTSVENPEGKSLCCSDVLKTHGMTRFKSHKSIFSS